MRAQLKRLHSPDIDIGSFWPQDVTNFGFLLQAMIGPEGEDSEESYDIFVCTPEWLRKKYSNTDVLFGEHMMIVFDYDINLIKQKISRYCERCMGKNWEEISKQLSHIGKSEFYNYISA